MQTFSWYTVTPYAQCLLSADGDQLIEVYSGLFMMHVGVLARTNIYKSVVHLENKTMGPE